MRAPRCHTLAHALAFGAIVWVLTHSLRAEPVSLAAVRSHLLQWEGLRLQPYRDRGAWSVGVGHNLSAHRQPVRRYTMAEVERFLLDDTAAALDACSRGIHRFDDLPTDVQLVAITLAFTTGRTGFDRFSGVRAGLSHRSYRTAAVELARSRWYHQVSRERADDAHRTLLKHALTLAP